MSPAPSSSTSPMRVAQAHRRRRSPTWPSSFSGFASEASKRAKTLPRDVSSWPTPSGFGAAARRAPSEASVDKGRSRAALVALAALFILAIALPASAPRGKEGVHPASTYMSSRDGAKALFLVLERLGFHVERRTLPLGDFGSARLAFVLGPEAPVDEDEANVKALVRWVNGGGTLVYAASMADLVTSPVGKAFGFRLVPKIRIATLERHVSLAAEYAPAANLAIMGEAQIAAARD